MHLAIRADGGPGIGYGHLVRTGALAEYSLGRGHRVTYVTATEEEAGTMCPDGVDVVGVSNIDAREEVAEHLGRLHPDVVVVDSYAADAAYQRAVADASPHLAVVMDDDRFRVHADCVVNGNVYAPDLDYEWSGDEPAWCLGPDYLLIRSAVRRLGAREPPWNESPETMLVTMGGSDVADATPSIVRSLDGVGVSVEVIVGPGFENRGEIRRAARETDATIELLEAPPDLPERMFRADLAVSATGSTVYELLALGTPTIGIPQAENQIPIAETLAERAAIRHLRPASVAELPDAIRCLLDDPEGRLALRERGRSIVDGRGTERVYQAMRGLAS